MQTSAFQSPATIEKTGAAIVQAALSAQARQALGTAYTAAPVVPKRPNLPQEKPGIGSVGSRAPRFTPRLCRYRCQSR